MKRLEAVPEGTLDRTTPVPNSLIDTFLPVLSDTELRVLLVVDRATLGWKEGAGRKQSDWLSHRQLQARTGRAGASVSHAVERLVRRGLLVVEDGSGQTRDSAHSRRANRGRLYYRLGDVLLQPAADKPPTAVQAEPQSLSTSSTLPGEVEAHIKQEERLEQVDAAADETGEDAVSSSLSRVQKVKTTKETGTKEKEDKVSSSKSEVNGLHKDSEEGEAEAVQDIQMEDLEPQVERFVGVFIQAYRLARPEEAVPPIEMAGRELLRRFVRQPGPAVLEAWLPAFFGSSFGYARRRGWSLECYLNCLFILQAQAGSKPLRQGKVFGQGQPLGHGRWQRATDAKSVEISGGDES